MKWYCRIGEKEVGPLEASQIRKLAAGGSLTASDLVRREDSDSWRKAGTIKGLFTPQKPADKATTKPRKRDQGVNPYLYEQVLQARRIARVWVFFGSVAMLGVINIALQGENAKTKIAPFGYFLAMVFFAVVPWGLWFFQRWAYGIAQAFHCILMIGFPIGTFIGLWAFGGLKEATACFNDPKLSLSLVPGAKRYAKTGFTGAHFAWDQAGWSPQEADVHLQFGAGRVSVRRSEEGWQLVNTARLLGLMTVQQRTYTLTPETRLRIDQRKHVVNMESDIFAVVVNHLQGGSGEFTLRSFTSLEEADDYLASVSRELSIPCDRRFVESRAAVLAASSDAVGEFGDIKLEIKTIDDKTHLVCLKNERIQILSLADYESPYATKKSFQYQLFLPSIVHNPRIVFPHKSAERYDGIEFETDDQLEQAVGFLTRETSLDIEWK